MPPVRVGTGVAFDEARGLGEIEAQAGQRFPFHCTAIADGTRTSPVGAQVCFAPVAGQLGRREARGIARLAAGAA